MTGYGRARETRSGRDITVEVRSVNNRYLDCAVKMPRAYIFAEDAVKARVQKAVSRGKVDVFITIDTSAADEAVVKLNRPLAQGYYKALCEINEACGLESEITASTIARFPDVLTVTKAEEDLESVAVDLCAVLDDALAAYNRMRATEGERLAAVETPIDDDKPMSKANKTMLLAILGAEFLWFMADNAIGTYIGNYVIYYLNSSSSATMVLTIAGGLASVIGFAIAGAIADRIGRKWTIASGLALSFAGLVIMCFVAPTGIVTGAHGEYAFPALLHVVWAIKGFGMALVHNCSFPMVVELCSSKKIGKFTGYYYTASMSAQTVTPVFLGFVFDATGAWRALPVYSSILILCSFAVFSLLVKNIKASKVENVVGLEALGDDD